MCLFCVVVHFFYWWMCAFVVLGLVFPYEAKRLSWGTSPKCAVFYWVGRKTLAIYCWVASLFCVTVLSRRWWQVVDGDVRTVLHDRRLAHTDLKPENILFVNSDYEYGETKRIHHKASIVNYFLLVCVPLLRNLELGLVGFWCVGLDLGLVGLGLVDLRNRRPQSIQCLQTLTITYSVKISFSQCSVICLERGENDLHMVQLIILPPHHLLLQ